MADLTLSRSQLLLLAGTANRPLAEEMAQHLGQPLCAVTLRRFADGEIFVKIDENVRGRDVFIIQPTNPPAENYWELLLLIEVARVLPQGLNAPLAIIDQRRPSANVAEVVNVVGEVEEKDCLIPDDMIDTAGTIAEAAAALRRLGARKSYAFASHALLSGPAV